MQSDDKKFRSTTILTVRHKGRVAIGGDGQVSLGNTVMKSDAVKIRPLADGRVIAGFAGGAADAFALLERFEAKLKDYPANMPRAATEFAKEWRTDRALRRLEAMIAVVDCSTHAARLRHGRRHPTDRRHPRHRLRRQLRPVGRPRTRRPLQPIRRRNRPRRPRNRRRHLRLFKSQHHRRRTGRNLIQSTTCHRDHRVHRETHSLLGDLCVLCG